MLQKHVKNTPAELFDVLVLLERTTTSSSFCLTFAGLLGFFFAPKQYNIDFLIETIF